MATSSQERSSTIGAVGWVAMEAILRQAGQFVVTMVLARLVAPEAFGLVAVLATLSGIVTVFVSGGFPSALIQKESVSDLDASTAFWANLGAATLLALVFVMSAPLIASFFRDERLISLTWVMSLNIWLTGWQTVHRALLSRDFLFRIQFTATAWSTALSGTVAIAAALLGAGVWALLFQTLLATFISTLFLWRFSHWQPVLAFSRESFTSLARFGLFISMSTLLNIIGTRFYTLVIGRLFPSGDLGHFHQAVTARELPQGLLSTVFSRVIFPLLSSRNRTDGDIVEAMRAALRSGMAINLPIMLGMSASATALIPTAFGPQWLPAIPVLQVICFAGALWPMQSVNITGLAAIGRSALVFRLEIAKKLILISAVVIASQWGLIAIAWGIVVASWINFLFNSYVTSFSINYRISQQIVDALPYACLAAVMAGLIWILESMLVNLAAPYRWLLEVLFGAVFYLSIGHIIGLKAFHDTRRFVKMALLNQRDGKGDYSKTP